MAWSRSPQRTVRRPRPTVRGIAIGAAGVVALVLAAVFGRVDLLFVGLLLVLLPMVAMVVLSLDRPWVTVERSYSPTVVAAGERSVATLVVRNEAGRPTPMLSWRDSIPAGMAEAERLDTTVGPGSVLSLGEHALASRDVSDRVTLRYRLGTARRGAFTVGPLLLRRTDPFGLAAGEYPVGGTRPLLVTPVCVPLPRSLAGSPQTEGSHHDLIRRSMPNIDELTAREYRTGDPMRRVHWRATARRDELMVRQEEQRSNPQAWIVLDTLRPRQRHADGAAFEQRIDLVASIGPHLIDQGYSLSVVETGRAQIEGGRGSEAASTGGFSLPFGPELLLAALAPFRWEDTADPGFGDEIARGLRTANGSAPLFAVLGEGASAGRTDALVGLGRSASPAVAILTGTAASAADFAEAGWLVVVAEAGESVTDIWSRALAASGGGERV